MVTRIRSGAQPHLYIREHREAKGLSLEELGGRITLHDKHGEKQGVERNTVWRWENDPKRLDPFKIAAIAYALGLDDWTELARPPGVRSLDAMLADQPDDVRDTAADIVARLIRRAS
jgi:transcriptional regulator with XRE-family HTH domain